MGPATVSVAMLTAAAFPTAIDPAAAVRSAIRHALAEGNLKLPILPQVASRVMALTRDPEADLADLSNLIHQDQSLAGNVLRIANSAAYRTGDPIVSLRQAVMQLGVSTLSEIALAACLHNEAFKAPGYESLHQTMLAHAFLSGGLAKELARRRRDNVEVAFLCGLLHSIGLPVGLTIISRLGEGPAGRPAETEALGLAGEFQHDIARVVTLAWGLPHEVQIVAVHHHDPAQAPGFVTETKLTALAGHLARWLIEPDGTGRDALLALPAWADLDLYPDDAAAVFARGEILARAMPLFGGKKS